MPLTSPHLSGRAPGSQAGAESKGAGDREEVSLVTDICKAQLGKAGQQQCQMSQLPSALWTKHREAAAHLCWASSRGSAPAFLQAGTGQKPQENWSVQAAKQFLLYKARPVTCLLPYTLPAVTPGLCRSAEVQSQQQL